MLYEFKGEGQLRIFTYVKLSFCQRYKIKNKIKKCEFFIIAKCGFYNRSSSVSIDSYGKLQIFHWIFASFNVNKYASP